MRRVSCTVVLLARHDPETHVNRYVLAQHYFGTPLGGIKGGSGVGSAEDAVDVGKESRLADASADEEGKVTSEGHTSTAKTNASMGAEGSQSRDESLSNSDGDAPETDGIPMRMWYVAEPFDVVCVADPIPQSEEDEDEEDEGEKERPLMAVDFGHAVWVEWASAADVPASVHVAEDADMLARTSQAVEGAEGVVATASVGGATGERAYKRLRFVSFPPIAVGEDGYELPAGGREHRGTVRTLALPPELDLDAVDTLNIDQSQGAVIISVKAGKIYVLYYE
jgi:hypothetical protein